MSAPTNIAEVADIIRSSKKVLAVGAQTKPRLSQCAEDVQLISMRGISGIVEYDPGEFTFTAFAGTPLREIVATLATQGQYLPFDPPLVGSGATIGGTVAAGLSGPGRFRYGGLRDFILAVRFLDGNGTQLRGGAKVVKNAAGFDIPKFLVGGFGRFGVLTEVTFKVFPCPPAMMSFAIPCANAAEATAHIAKAASGRWEFDALDYDGTRVLARIRGPQAALDLLAADIARHWPDAADIGNQIWDEITEWKFASPGSLIAKVPLTLKILPLLESAMRGTGFCFHMTGGGSFAYVYGPPAEPVDELRSALAGLDLPPLVLSGSEFPQSQTEQIRPVIADAVKRAFDPLGRFSN